MKDTQKWDSVASTVLRIEGIFTTRTHDALYCLYEKIPVGGIVSFDDVFSHPDVMRCRVDFKSAYQLPE